MRPYEGIKERVRPVPPFVYNMADTRRGREKKAADKERSQRKREVEEAREHDEATKERLKEHEEEEYEEELAEDE